MLDLLNKVLHSNAHLSILQPSPEVGFFIKKKTRWVQLSIVLTIAGISGMVNFPYFEVLDVFDSKNHWCILWKTQFLNAEEEQRVMPKQKNGGKGKKPNFERHKHFRSTPDVRRRKQLVATNIQEGKRRKREEILLARQ